MNYSTEQIFHFTCDQCELWWSIAVENVKMDKRTWTCPWCSHDHLPPHYNLVDGVAHIDRGPELEI